MPPSWSFFCCTRWIISMRRANCDARANRRSVKAQQAASIDSNRKSRNHAVLTKVSRCSALLRNTASRRLSVTEASSSCCSRNAASEHQRSVRSRTVSIASGRPSSTMRVVNTSTATRVPSRRRTSHSMRPRPEFAPSRIPSRQRSQVPPTAMNTSRGSNVRDASRDVSPINAIASAFTSTKTPVAVSRSHMASGLCSKRRRNMSGAWVSFGPGALHLSVH